ncbi:MAG TPA: cytochrome c3 family protein [Opitutaceae bacterium]|nr:cytochrome c3 family protein [Opitutaceae bacterium]
MSLIFPKWSNRLPLQITIYLFVLGGTVTAGVTYYCTPKYLRVGYQPVQPVPYDHSLHAGQLGIDCRYCHSNVDQSGFANLPTAQTCMNCHKLVKPQSPLLAVVRASFESGEPVPWVQIHKTPDYVYFNHAIHVNRGISCVECHGRINEMPVVYESQSLSMKFCLNCHRNPGEFLRAPADVYNLESPTLAAAGKAAAARAMIADWHIKPPQSCSGCHR